MDDKTGGKYISHRGIARRRKFAEQHKPEIPSDIPDYIRNFIYKYKDATIQYVTVCRTPIPGAIEALANIVTMGDYEKEKANRNIDKFVHLFMLIGLSNGRRIVYEKNQRVTLFETYKSLDSNDAQCVAAPPPPAGLTFKQFVINGINYAGRSDYFLYNALSNNCQMFVQQNLIPNNMWSERIAHFTMQNVDQIVPNWVKNVMRTGTSLAAAAEKITGFTPNKKWTEGEQIDHPILETRREQEEAEQYRDEVTGEGLTGGRRSRVNWPFVNVAKHIPLLGPVVYSAATLVEDDPRGAKPKAKIGIPSAATAANPAALASNMAQSGLAMSHLAKKAFGGGDSRGGVAIHGRYCGPNWTAGMHKAAKDVDLDTFNKVSPTDDLDAGCKEHDWRCGHVSNSLYGDCSQEDDQRLINVAKQVAFSNKYPLYLRGKAMAVGTAMKGAQKTLHRKNVPTPTGAGIPAFAMGAY